MVAVGPNHVVILRYAPYLPGQWMTLYTQSSTFNSHLGVKLDFNLLIVVTFLLCLKLVIVLHSKINLVCTLAETA